MRPDDRPGLRELVAAAINSSNLAPCDIRETNVDRIGALAFADPLGGALWAIKYAGEARAFKDVLDLLVRRSKRVCGDFKICRTALVEWLDDLCNACGGRGSLLASDTAPVRQCETCHGSGKRKVSEVWRARELGLDREQYLRCEPRYVAVQRKIVDAEVMAWHDVARQLGRRYAEAFDGSPEAQAGRVELFRLWTAAIDSGARLATLRARGANMRPGIAHSQPAGHKDR